MIIKPLIFNEHADMNLGGIEGTREELTLLRDELIKLLADSYGDPRGYSRGFKVDNGGFWIRKTSEGV